EACSSLWTAFVRNIAASTSAVARVPASVATIRHARPLYGCRLLTDSGGAQGPIEELWGLVARSSSGGEVVGGGEDLGVVVAVESPSVVFAGDGDAAGVDVVVVVPAEQDAFVGVGGAVVGVPPQGVVDL